MVLIRPAASLALLACLCGCYGAPTAQQPYQAGAAAAPILVGSQCAAGFYQCALPVAGQVGTGCTCPGLGGPSYGVIR